MRPLLKRDVDVEARVSRPDTEAEAESRARAAEDLLQEISEDARKLEARYAKDTAVPGGGE